MLRVVLLVASFLGAHVLSGVEAWAANTQPSDIRQFVHQTFIRGVPYGEAVRFDPATAVPALLAMLADHTEEAHWPNIVVTLGMLGDDRALGPLIQFLERDGAGGPLPQTQYAAKTSVLLSLGYLVNKTGNQRALSYLKDSLQPDVWRMRQVNWVSPYHNTVERNLQLSKMAVIGLGLSGYPSAAEALRSLQAPPTTEVGRRFNAVISEALSAHEAISKEGLAAYDRRSKNF
jgi:hypothetical protein